jgi:hypothetical protein
VGLLLVHSKYSSDDTCSMITHPLAVSHTQEPRRRYTEVKRAFRIILIRGENTLNPYQAKPPGILDSPRMLDNQSDRTNRSLRALLPE